MKLRKKPAVLRFHKFKAEKDINAYWFSEAMLYLPHSNEEDLVTQIEAAKTGGSQTWEELVDKITFVKNQVMEYLQDNEEARMMTAETILYNTLTGEFSGS